MEKEPRKGTNGREKEEKRECLREGKVEEMSSIVRDRKCGRLNEQGNDRVGEGFEYASACNCAEWTGHVLPSVSGCAKQGWNADFKL